MPEMEHHPRKVVVTVEQIRPRTNREGQVPIYHETEDAVLSAPGMASSLPQIVNATDVDFTHAIVLLKCSKQVRHTPHG